MKPGTTAAYIVRLFCSGHSMERIAQFQDCSRYEVEHAIRCAVAVYAAPSFVAWAVAWLSGEARSARAARAATGAAIGAAAWAAAGAAGAAGAATGAPLITYAEWAMTDVITWEG